MSRRLPKNISDFQKRRLIIPLVLLLLLVASTVSFYLMHTTRLLDEREEKQIRQRTEAALEAEIKELATHAYEYGVWNDRIHKLIVQSDPIRADRDIGSYLFESFGISTSLVIDSEDRPITGYIEGQRIGDISILEEILPQVKTLLDQARDPAFYAMKSTAGFVRIDQITYLAAAQAIIPEKIMTLSQKEFSTLLLLKSVDQALLNLLSKNYFLPQFGLSSASKKPVQAVLWLNSFSGEQIGFLHWQPEHAGKNIFHTLAPAIPVTLLLALMLILLFLRYMQQFFSERLLLFQQVESEAIRLEEKEGILHAVVEAIPSPMFFKDIEGSYLGCNQAFCAFLGETSPRIIGRKSYEVSQDKQALDFHQADLKLMKQGGMTTYEFSSTSSDGNQRDFLCSKSVIESGSDTIIGLVGIMTDISDIKDVQRESRVLRNRLRNIIDAMPSMLITVDENQIVTEWNRWAAIASRVPTKKALGQSLTAVFPALLEQNIDITTVLEQGEVQTWPRIPWKFNNKDIYIDLTAYPLGEGKESGAVLRADNITDRVQMEKVLVLSEKMLSVGSLAAGMAHEINNPLAIMLQHTQILQNRLNPELTKNLETARTCNINLDNLADYLDRRGIGDMLDAIRHAGDRAKTIVDEMVHFSQQHKSEFKPCNLPGLLDETLHLAESDYDLKKKYGFRNVAIRKDISEDLPELTCDRNEIQQVILNLIRNSAMALHGANTEKPVIQIHLANNEQEIQIALTDNGPGIAPTLLNRIFDPFFTTAQAGEGAGLGLSVAYFIICEKHGGSIRAENTERGGCRFIIRLPLEIPHIAAQEIA